MVGYQFGVYLIFEIRMNNYIMNIIIKARKINAMKTYSKGIKKLPIMLQKSAFYHKKATKNEMKMQFKVQFKIIFRTPKYNLISV